MSGFSDAWLSARAAWDSPARSRSVEDALVGWARKRAPDGQRLRVVDLGAGNGNNQRHLAPLLPAPVDWMLVDSDQALLASAERTADLKPGDSLVAEVTDLAHADLAKLVVAADLVTASALFDLASQDWLDNLLDALADEGTALLAVLTYDGRIEAGTDQETLAEVRDLVNRHQRTDKGFGPALGPDASAALSAGLAARAYDVRDGESDWIVAPGDPGTRELVGGWVEAASEMAPERVRDFEAWAETLYAQPEAKIRVGHRDHFATPPLS
ncbi:class I SAM-dependent methyltransferase [Nisaea nitritireducens]|uniref:class I SAM-dependent methyltransferase n=1 Tax=Nisaea nitritireducens TaxID=568392 RepID=UPI001866062F|nr:class I SAM-dependent methyltransferase [Nisaea nitritireducens]